MNLAVEGASFIDVLASYTRTLIFFCLIVQIVSMVLSYIFRKPSLQRMAMSMTTGFAAFAAGSYNTNSQILWVILFLLTFFSTYYFMPRFVSEDSADAKKSQEQEF